MESQRRDWVSRSGLEWENLGFCSNSNNHVQNLQNQQIIDLSAMSNHGGGGGVWSEDEIGKLGSGYYSYNDVMLKSLDTTTSGEALTGLRLGRQQKHYVGKGLLSVSSPSSLPLCSAKRSRASYQNMQNPCCQVQGCNLDLKLAKDYHRRHRICETHSKSPKVIVAGLERRFCQQCSRFHELSEFDDKKRSCRRRLSDHNARRRRVQPESISGNNMTMPSSSAASLYGNNNVLLNGLPVSLSNSANNHHHYPLRVAQDQWGMGMGMGMGMGIDGIASAQSLLSSGPVWSLNGESMDGGALITGNNQAATPIKAITNEGEEGNESIPVDSITTTTESHLQEFHLFYDPAGAGCTSFL